MSKVTDFIEQSAAKDEYANMCMSFDREMENRFSHWFNAVKDCGMLVPKTFVFNVPPQIASACGDSSDKNVAIIRAWLDEAVMPTLKANRFDQRRLFIKNAVFSNKFFADGSCIADTATLATAMININQGAMCCIMGYDGTDELVVREYIPYNANSTACIYHGLAFRTEYRVFYDFDKHEPIFVADYWDKDHVRSHLYDITDQLVYDGAYPAIKAKFEANKTAVMNMVAAAMANITDLHGPWSIDVMSEGDRFYLIDMAVAEQSAYWDCRPGCEQTHDDQPEQKGEDVNTANCILLKDPE